MKTIKSSVKTEVVMDEECTQRYLLKKDWSTKGKEKIVAIIMIQPSSSSEIQLDMTTLYVINNVYELGYNVVNIVNIFSGIVEEYITDSINNDYIMKAIEESEMVVWGVGNAGKYNKVIRARIEDITNLIQEHMHKVCILVDGKEEVPRHPLSPGVRTRWTLKNNISLI